MRAALTPLDGNSGINLILNNNDIKGKITFENVHFEYPSKNSSKHEDSNKKINTVLNNFNLTINSGETIALVGPSGCGKSTIAKLINRFYDPQIGTIKLDDMNLKNINLQSLRSIIGHVNQEPVLFAGTVQENISLGTEILKAPSGDEIMSASNVANAREFIKNFKNGMNTFLGTKGDQLSGGQKQRLSIVQALRVDIIMKNTNR